MLLKDAQVERTPPFHLWTSIEAKFWCFMVFQEVLWSKTVHHIYHSCLQKRDLHVGRCSPWWEGSGCLKAVIFFGASSVWLSPRHLSVSYVACLEKTLRLINYLRVVWCQGKVSSHGDGRVWECLDLSWRQIIFPSSTILKQWGDSMCYWCESINLWPSTRHPCLIWCSKPFTSAKAATAKSSMSHGRYTAPMAAGQNPGLSTTTGGSSAIQKNLPNSGRSEWCPRFRKRMEIKKTWNKRALCLFIQSQNLSFMFFLL